MLFIPMSISGVSGTLSAVSASANEYRPLIAQEDRAGFTAQTLQTDGKTLTVSYANAAAATSGEYISAAVKNSSGAYTYYGKVKAATDASGTVTVTLPDGITPAADTLYIFNEQHSTVSNAKTGLSSNMQKVCITHSFEVSDQGDTNEHILKCSACSYQTSEAHDFTYVSDDNDATHTGTCRVCKKTVSGTHSLHIIGYDPGVHTKRCDICSYIANVPHNFIYTDNGNGTHTRACTLCGNSTVSAHSFAYVDRGDGISKYVCGDCGAGSGIFSYNRSVIPDGCRDITKLVDKNSVATSVSTWGDGRVDYLFDDFFNKFGGWGNNIGGTTTVLPATFELTKSAAVRGIAVWTGSDTRSYSNRNPDTVRLYAKDSTDGDFEKIAEISTANLPEENYKPYTYTFPATAKPYKYFKVEFQNSRGTYEGTQVGELKLLGAAQTPVEFETENIRRTGEDGTVAGEDFACTLYAHGGHPAADKVEVLADGVNFTDYSYDAATGVLKIDGAKVTDASYTIRAAGEKFTATVTPEVGRLRFTGDKTAQIGTDYTAKLADSKGGTSTLPEYIAVLIDGYMLDEEFFSYDKKTGDITINGAVITDDIRISAFEMYKLTVLDEQVTENRTSGTVTAEGCTGSWSFDADSYTLRLEGFNGSFVCRETATAIVRYSGKENLTLELSDCSITTDYTMFFFDNRGLVIMSTDGDEEEKSTADITVKLTGSNKLSTDDYVFYGQNITVQADGTSSMSAAVAVVTSGMNITGKGSLILDCLNTMAVQGMIYYGANKPTKSAFYQQSHLEYKNGVLTPGGLDLDIDGDLLVRNGKLNTELFDDPDEAPFDYREAPFSYKDGVLTFRDNTVISEITFTAIGDVKYVFDGAAELSSDYSTVFNQVYGSASFEAADGADVKIKSDQDSAIRAYSAVSFNGGGRITV